MAHGQFRISAVNPNDTMGGGGCLCGEVKPADCKPPYVVFMPTEMLSGVSPYPVLCATCLVDALAALENGEVLEIGARVTPSVDSPAPTPPLQDESPEFEDSALLDALKAKD